MALPPAFDDLDPVVDRLVGTYGDDRRAQVERVVVEAWHALRSIQDLVDRRVTTERLARIELHARSEMSTDATGTEPLANAPGPVVPAQRTQAVCHQQRSRLQVLAGRAASRVGAGQAGPN